MGKLLVLAAGRRRYVAAELLRARGPGDALFLADSDLRTPGLALPDASVLEEPLDARAADAWLLSVCEEHSLDAVLSLHDYQALRVSRLRDELIERGCQWIGPSPEIAQTLVSKSGLSRFLLDRAPDLAIPTYRQSDDLPASVDDWIVKDDLGSGSSGLRTGLSLQEARLAIQDASLVAQPAMEGDEWNLDFFVWRDGSIRGVSAKRKMRMRGGETDAAEVVPHGKLPFEVEAIVSAFAGIDHLGNVDVDVFVSGSRIKVIDVNPRFGGGYAFSIAAGYRAAEAVWTLVNRVDVPIAVEADTCFFGAKSIEVVAL